VAGEEFLEVSRGRMEDRLCVQHTRGWLNEAAADGTV
jgi:hypothetical protein